MQCVFKLKDFKEYPSIIPSLEKLNKALEKANHKRLYKIIDDLLFISIFFP